MRPLTTDERASFVILSLYMALFCLCTFLYWDSLVLRILGVTAASAGLFLFVAAFFNTEAPERSRSVHPLRTYLFSFFTVLATMALLRFLGGLIEHTPTAVAVVYGGLVVALVVFRKAMVQVVTALLALAFLFVTLNNWEAVLGERMTFRETARQCGTALFRIGPIQDMAALLIAGNYMGYLNKIDYRDEQINILATRTVAGAGDDELLKTKAILDFVSNKIHYVSDPVDGLEYAKHPITTLIAGGGDCEDKTLLLCSMLESVGVKTYVVFTDDHVFALVRFTWAYPELEGIRPVFVEGHPCHVLDAADPGARIGEGAASPASIRRVFDVHRRLPVRFSLDAGE